MPILGTVASQFSGKPFGSYESIATVTVGSESISTITFSSIPQTYTHLQVRTFQKTNSAGDLNFKFNNNSGANYSRHYLYGQGSGAAESGGSASESQGYIGYNPSSTYFQSAVIDILDYTNTNKNKTVRSLLGTDANGSGYILLTSSGWFSTSAVTTLSFTQGLVNNFSQYSSFALYGIKGS